jgi:PAS domain S-box-containing protein
MDPICVVDATPVCAFLEGLRAAGTRDVATHLATHPGDLGECLARLEVLEANPRFRELFGSSPPGATARDALRAFAPQALATLGAAVIEHLEGRDPSDLEVPVTDPRGRERYVSIRWSSYAGPKRGSRHLLLAFVDVTERRQAEDEVRRSERRYRELADMLPEAVFEADATGRLVFVNRAAIRLFGYSRDEIDAGLCLDSLVAGRNDPGDDPNAPARPRSDSRSVEYTARRKDGSVFPVMVRVGPVERDGAPRGLRGVVVDLTERKRAEEALRASEERYRAVVQDQTEVISRFLPDGTLTFVNDVYCRLFGRASDELVGTRWHPVADPVDVPHIEAQLRTLSPARPVVVIENRVTTHDGRVRWMQFVNRAFYGPDGRVRDIQSVGRDVTGRKEAEEALRDLAKRLTEAIEGERRRVARLVHDELGQNLAALGLDLAQIEASGQSALPEATRARLAEAARLVEETALMARTLVGDLRPRLLEEYGLAAALRSLADDLGARTGIRVIERIDEVPGPRPDLAIECHLYRIAQEALANAARHASPGCITLTLTHTATSSTVTVSDDGRGFVPGERPAGGGFGLIHMRERATAAGGVLRVDASPGAGTTVSVEVPR